MRFKDFITSMLSDAESGGISSKRVIGLIAFTVFMSLVYINTYTDYKTPDVIVDGLMWIILGAFLGSTLEYFSKRTPITSPVTTVQSNDAGTKVTVGQQTTPVAEPQKPQVPVVVTVNNENVSEVELVDKQIPE